MGCRLSSSGTSWLCRCLHLPSENKADSQAHNQTPISLKNWAPPHSLEPAHTTFSAHWKGIEEREPGDTSIPVAKDTVHGANTTLDHHGDVAFGVVGVVSLSFQIFSGCVKGYQLLSEAKGLEKDYHHVRLRLQAEMFRLLDWANVAGLSPRDSTLRIGRASKGLLLSVLEQQHDLLAHFGRYDDKLSPLAKPMILEEWDLPETTVLLGSINGKIQEQHIGFPQTEDLFNKAMSVSQRIRSLPKRLSWICGDKAKINTLIERLSAHNDFLKDMLNSEQTQQLLDFQERTYYQIMHLNSTVDQLTQIVLAQKADMSLNSKSDESGKAIASISRATTLAEEPDKETTHIRPSANLGVLARAKALNIAMEEGELANTLPGELGLDHAAVDPASAIIPLAQIEFLENVPDELSVMEFPRTEALIKEQGALERKRIWIEWIIIRPQHQSWSRGRQRPGEAKQAQSMSRNLRLSALVALCRDERNRQAFRAAHCLGFVQPSFAGEDALCGLVFRKPDGYDQDSSPISLLELLQRNDESRIPSLSQRVMLALALAQFVERLHAVNWLHKGLRSYNVLFFGRKSSSVAKNPKLYQDGDNFLDLSAPLLTGFDYSRPNGRNDWTQKGSLNPAHDIYRHPEVQFDSGRDADDCSEHFKRVFDIYSLGILLLEVVYWKPCHVIMAIDLDRAKLKDTMRVRRLLLEEPSYLAYVDGRAGAIFREVIETCLKGAAAFGLPDDYSDMNTAEAVALQAKFYSQVVQRLGEIRI